MFVRHDVPMKSLHSYQTKRRQNSENSNLLDDHRENYDQQHW